MLVHQDEFSSMLDRFFLSLCSYVWLTREVPDDWRIANVTVIYKKCRKEDLGNPQACQPDLGARQDYGAVHPECAHQVSEGQPGDQAHPAWVQERQVLLDQPDLLL